MSDRGIKRREFLGKTALGLFTAGFGLPKLKAGTPGQERPNKIVYRTLGRTNLRIPVVSFGVMNSDSPDLINQALEKGVNHLDTAHLYLRGNSERVIGEVLESSGKRDKVYIATKMRLARDREKGYSALKWVLEDENVCTTIPGMTTFEQLETNIRVIND